MKITTTTPTSTSNVGARRRTSGSGGAFAAMLEAAEESASASSAGATGGVASVSSIYAAQEVNDRESRRRKAVRQAGFTLDALDDLRTALLMGEVPAPMLRRIGEQLARQRAETVDGELLGVMREIEVRAAVELAKLEMAAARR